MAEAEWTEAEATLNKVVAGEYHLWQPILEPIRKRIDYIAHHMDDKPPSDPADAQAKEKLVANQLSTINTTLTTNFSQQPPHTIQRLAELLSDPNKHYRVRSSFLHALDRVVHVTSTASTYPLPAAIPDAAGQKILSNGAPTGPDPALVSWGASTVKDPSFGSDESLGGALLTPIPWIISPVAPNPSLHSLHTDGLDDLESSMDTESTETIDGPNGLGSIETVSISLNGISSTRLPLPQSSPPDLSSQLRAEGGVTQGEILRQEQKAGVVPAAHLAAEMANREEEDEVPHARGPEEVGMSDLGPQKGGRGLLSGKGVDIEAAVGRTTGEGGGILGEGTEEGEEDGKEGMEGEEKEDEMKEMLTPIPMKREAEDDLESGSKRLKEDDGKEDKVDDS